MCTPHRGSAHHTVVCGGGVSGVQCVLWCAHPLWVWAVWCAHPTGGLHTTQWCVACSVWCAVCFLFLFSFLFLFLFRFYFFDSDAVGRHQNGNQPLLAADFWRLCAAAPPCFCAENSLVWQTSEFLGPRIAGRRPGALQPGPQIPVGPQKGS